MEVKLKPKPFNEYFEEWYKLYKVKIEDNTLRHYKYTLKAIEDFLGDIAIQKITKNKYQKFLNDFGEGKARETVSKVNSHIRESVLDAIDEGLIHIDFTRKATIYYTVEAKKPSEKHLDYNESTKLMKEVIKRLDRGLGYYMILLALSSGLRYEELIGLTKKDFDFENNTINVDKTWGYNISMHKGFGPTKNETSNRIVYVSPEVMKFFEELFKVIPTNINQLIFYSSTSKYQVISNTNVNKILRNVLKDLKIKTITLHGLRHTYASLLLYKRLSLGYVSESLGHKNTITTQQDYAHVLSELKREDGERAIDIFSKMVV